MKKEIYNKLVPLFDIVEGIEELLDENHQLKEENKRLQERIEQFEKSLEEKTKASSEAMHDVLHACLYGHIITNNNETIIKHE